MKPDNKPRPKAVLRRLKDPLYDAPEPPNRCCVYFFADGRITWVKWVEGRTVVERGRCWTCKWWRRQWTKEELSYGQCENPNIPWIKADEESPEEKWGSDPDADPCPYWQADIEVCEKHGEYLKDQGCIACQMGKP